MQLLDTQKAQAAALDTAKSQSTAPTSDPSAKNAQMTQGAQALSQGNLAAVIEQGESKSPGNEPYSTFNYYRDSGGLGSSHFGLIDGKPIHEHTIGKLLALSKKGSTLNISYTDGDAPRTVTGRLFAMGRYQIIPDTLSASLGYAGLTNEDTFSKVSQDNIYNKFLTKSVKRKNLAAYLEGNGNINDAALDVAKEWATFGIRPGLTNSKGKVGNESGMTSYYEGDGVNSAHVSYFTLVDALQKDRAAISAGSMSTQVAAYANQPQAAPAAQSPTPAAEKTTSTTTETSGDQPQPAPAAAVQHVSIDTNRAVRINKQYGYSRSTWREIQSTAGLTGGDVDGIVGPVTCQAIADWQAKAGFTGGDVDGICGPNTLAKMRSSMPSAQQEEVQDTQKEQEKQGATSTQPANTNKAFKYFTIAELCHSDTAVSRGIDNSPTEEVVQRLTALVTNALDPIREAYGAPLRVNSGYRSPAVNKAVGGSSTSEHMTGEAADLSTGSKTGNRNLFNLIQTLGVPFRQLINEYDYSWIHVSHSSTKANNKQVFSIG